VTINDTPELDPIQDVTACDSYDLPVVGDISGTNLVSPKYYDDSQANEGQEITDLTITSTQTIWVYDETGTDPNCFDETSFTVTINDTPELDPIQDVTACDSYDLPVVGDISGTNLVSPKYYDNSQANGGEEITDLTLTSSQTVWVYDETGTDPNCFDEISFEVTINETPKIFTSNPEPICEGDSVDLANYVSNPDGGNLSYYLDMTDAENGENFLLSSIVSPGLGDTTYYVRAENTLDDTCYSLDSIVVSVIICVFDEGCTLGYWKNHTDRWCENTYTIDEEEVTILTCTLYGDVFTSAPTNGKLGIAGLTLLEAINLEGNSNGENLARQSVAALLNTCSSEVGFAYSSVYKLIQAVNLAWEANPKTQNSFAMELDRLNNAYCPLGGSPATTAPSPDCVNGEQAFNVNQIEVIEKSSERQAQDGFNVYPVPFQETLNVQYSFEYQSSAKIQIFDLNGQLLEQFIEANAGPGVVSTFNVSFRVKNNAVYIVRVETDRASYVKKIISSR
ncbi:T9SS type A sorting domain-containing protein, partial [Salegentibacter sp. HM20]